MLNTLFDRETNFPCPTSDNDKVLHTDRFKPCQRLLGRQIEHKTSIRCLYNRPSQPPPPTFVMEENYEQHTSAIGSLRSILQSYPFSVGIFREILQNSDDAGASKQVRDSSYLKLPIVT